MQGMHSINDSAGDLADALRWRLEQLGWAIERRLLWPLQERLGLGDGPLRTAGIAAVAVAAIGVGVGGLIWAAPNDREVAAHIGVPGPAALTHSAQPARTPVAAPTLHGAPPVLRALPGEGSRPVTSDTVKAAGAVAAKEGSASASTAVVPGEVAGPAAIAVARQFSNAFVRYETGQIDAKVRADFAATATPDLVHSLLQRPPRLPANVKIPEARVLNVVAGPKIGDVDTVSVSLLRVGVTSELRLSMRRGGRSATGEGATGGGDWQVTSVLG